jgi:hypothetical protein
MTLCDQACLNILNGIGFIQHYGNPSIRVKYLAEGKHLFRASVSGGLQLTPGAMIPLLSTRLLQAPEFVMFVRKKRPFASPKFYYFWSEPAARYMLDNDWLEIIKP